jgi:Ser/Thr protein kinase RdoA (MazF antagonist)
LEVLNTENQDLEEVLSTYHLLNEFVSIEKYGNGLINHTWKLTCKKETYIVQKINEQVFTNPKAIEENIHLISSFFKNNFKAYFFVSPLTIANGQQMICTAAKNYYRVFPFVPNSFCLNIVATPKQAFEAAAQFGKFTQLLSKFEVATLNTTIPDFHNLNLRYNQFITAIENGNKNRIKEALDLINYLKNLSTINETYTAILANPNFKLRVTHHDTKISNVLFTNAETAACVIDLDTMMPGYFISDVGDMIRTYVSPTNEDEKDLNKITIHLAFYKAIVEGYKSQMKHELTKAENANFFYAGQFMIYMQALRFLTDYLNDDIYYKTEYEDHNYWRAKNQIVLLQRYMEVEEDLKKNL